MKFFSFKLLLTGYYSKQYSQLQDFNTLKYVKDMQ